MGKKRRLEILEIEQHPQANLSDGSSHGTQSRGGLQPIHPHGSSHPTHSHDTLQTARVPRASQPHSLPRTSEPSNVDAHASERVLVNDQPMDKTWMTKSRLSREYLQGVIGFLHFASRNMSKDGTISCPCVKCLNNFMLSPDVVHDHLLTFGISQGYYYWYCHGETISAPSSSKIYETPVEQVGLQFGDMEEMLHDMFHMHSQSSNEMGDETHEVEPSGQSPSEQSVQEPNENAQRFYNLLKDAKQPLYEGCKTFSKLSAIVHWYHLKCLKGLSNETFTLILQTLKAMLPSDAKLPKDCYEAKKIIKDLGLGYEKIHACPKGCMLFWKEHANDDFCKKCGLSRWATNDDNLEPRLGTSNKKGKRKAAKVLRWLPLKPRLQRLYMTLETAEAMKWHAQGRTKDGEEVIMYTQHLVEDNVSNPRNKQGSGDAKEPWTKRSIFADLSYYPDLLLRNNLDAMHIIKNVVDNVIGTLLNIAGKTKDNLKARLDLVVWGIRHELHPQMLDSNKTYLPPACFSMLPKEKDDFLRVLKRVKVPDGYASNLSRCVHLKERKIIGMKSHDSYILMQQLLPIALRGTLPKHVVTPLIEQ